MAFLVVDIFPWQTHILLPIKGKKLIGHQFVPNKESTLDMQAKYALYRRILQMHRAKLGNKARRLGDAYVKQEFRVPIQGREEIFIFEWQQYLRLLVAGANTDLEPLADKLNSNQLEKLREMKNIFNKN